MILLTLNQKFLVWMLWSWENTGRKIDGSVQLQVEQLLLRQYMINWIEFLIQNWKIL